MHEPQVLEKPFSLFTHWIKEGIRRDSEKLTAACDKIVTPTYLAKSAQRFYPEVSWEEALDSYEDGLGFMQFLTENLQNHEALNETLIRELIQKFNTTYADKGIQTCLTVIDDEITIVDLTQEGLDAQKIADAGELRLIASSGRFNAAIDIPGYTKHIAEEDGIKFNFRTKDEKPPQHSALIVLDIEKLAQSPSTLLIEWAHEVGHYDETMNAETFDHIVEDGNTLKDCIPNTERTSAIYALKVSQLLDKLKLDGTRDSIKHIEQAALYNRVIFGDVEGKKI